MSYLGIALLILINVYTLVLWARLVLDWLRVLVPSFHPHGLVLVLAEGVYTVTDPPLKFLRRFIKPIRVGQIAIDIAWLVLIVGLSLLSVLVQFLFRVV